MAEPYIIHCEPEQAEPIYRLLLSHRGSMTFPVETLSLQTFRDRVFDNSNYFYYCLDGDVLALLWMGPVDPFARAAEFGVVALKGGAGHGREATAKLLDYGFQSLGLHRMFCTVNANNTFCLKAIEKFGYLTQEGRLRGARFLDGQHIDQVVFSILETDPRG